MSTNGQTGLPGFISDLTCRLTFDDHQTVYETPDCSPGPAIMGQHSCSWGHYLYLCCGHPWLPAHLSLQSTPALDTPEQLALASLRWVSIMDLGLTQCWLQPLWAEHHGLVLINPNPVGGCRPPIEASCNPMGCVAHPTLTVIPSVTSKWVCKGS